MAQKKRFELWFVERTLREQGFPRRKALLVEVVDPMAIRNTVAICAYFGMGLAGAKRMTALTLVSEVYGYRDWSLQPPGELVERVERLLSEHPGELTADVLADDSFDLAADSTLSPGKYIPWSFLKIPDGVGRISAAFGLATLWALGRPDDAASQIQASLGAPGGFGSLDEFRTRCGVMVALWLEEAGGGTDEFARRTGNLPPSLVEWAVSTG